MRKKLIELLLSVPSAEFILGKREGKRYTTAWHIANHLIANGVTIQSDDIERLSRGFAKLQVRMLGHDKEFNERMAGYTPSAFCAGFDYAIQLAKGLLTTLPEPPKGE